MPQRMERKTRNRCKIKSKNPRGSRDCIHPGCCRTMQKVIAEDKTAALHIHLESQHGCRCFRRKRRSRPWKYRSLMPLCRSWKENVYYSKEFGNVNAVPICLDTQDTGEIIQAVKNIAPGFGGINLEDISAPRCFEIEERLKEMLDIPVFHDDQHGTAIVVLAGVINGLRVTGKKKEDCRVVVNGAGSAGVAITKLLLTYGFKHVTMCDREGIIGKRLSELKLDAEKMTEVTNLENTSGTLADALRGADIFVGVSAPNIVTPEMVSSMNKDAILFAMANPVPEIMPDVAKAAGAKVVGTGRSDFPNQVNNVIAFPGIFRGALEAHATQITEKK